MTLKQIIQIPLEKQKQEFNKLSRINQEAILQDWRAAIHKLTNFYSKILKSYNNDKLGYNKQSEK